MTTEVEDRARLYSAMNQGNPFRSYKKTILGKVLVTVLDSFSNTPKDLILMGDPKKNEKGTVIDVWSEREDVFFKQMNDVIISKGLLIPFTRKEEVQVHTIEQSTDEELKEVLSSKFFTFQSLLNSVSNTPVLYRLKDLAVEMDKSEKIIKIIDARISEVQSEEYTVKPTENE